MFKNPPFMNYRIPDGIFFVIVLYHTTNLYDFTTVFIIDRYEGISRVTVQAHLILGAPFVHCCRGGP